MLKLKEKDKKIRLNFNTIEKQHFILKLIFTNFNFFFLVRWNAFLKLKSLTIHSSKISSVCRCLNSSNKKRFNKLTTFSRNTFLKLIRSGSISGMQKST